MRRSSPHPASRRPRLRPLAIAALVAAPLALHAPAAGPAAAIAPPKVPALKGLAAPTTRLLVFAPHPDDATIAAGGLVHRVAAAGGRVRVVFLTSGDGFPPGVRRETAPRPPTPDDYRAYARRREGEARRALGALGVRRRDVRFLGFPDQGLCPILRRHRADAPPYFRSPFTGADRPPADEAVVHDAEYDAADLVAEVARVTRAFRPTLVVAPDAADAHPDHCATAAVVQAALRAIAAETPPLRPPLVRYVVHLDGWPPPLAAPFRPPPGFPAPRVRFPLAPADVAAKARALAQHRTQMDAMAGYLGRFVREHEVFVVSDAIAGADRCACAPTP